MEPLDKRWQWQISMQENSALGINVAIGLILRKNQQAVVPVLQELFFYAAMLLLSFLHVRLPLFNHIFFAVHLHTGSKNMFIDVHYIYMRVLHATIPYKNYK